MPSTGSADVSMPTLEPQEDILNIQRDISYAKHAHYILPECIVQHGTMLLVSSF